MQKLFLQVLAEEKTCMQKQGLYSPTTSWKGTYSENESHGSGGEELAEEPEPTDDREKHHDVEDPFSVDDKHEVIDMFHPIETVIAKTSLSQLLALRLVHGTATENCADRLYKTNLEESISKNANRNLVGNSVTWIIEILGSDFRNDLLSESMPAADCLPITDKLGDVRIIFQPPTPKSADFTLRTRLRKKSPY